MEDFDLNSIDWDSIFNSGGGYDPGGESLYPILSGQQSEFPSYAPSSVPFDNPNYTPGNTNVNWWQQGPEEDGKEGGVNWAKLMGRGGAGNAGVGSLIMLLNAMRQRKDAKKGEEDERAAVQQGTNTMARALSTQGNPAGNPHAQQEMQNYATIALNRYKETRRARMNQANNNLYGAGGASLQALLAAMSENGAFS